MNTQIVDDSFEELFIRSDKVKINIDKNEWRLMGQEKYLKNEKLIYSSYKSEKDGHNHCEFCFAKFGSGQEELDSGYCTTEGYRWICESCFRDFKDIFQWQVISD